jgi:hypothetical protein
MPKYSGGKTMAVATKRTRAAKRTSFVRRCLGFLSHGFALFGALVLVLLLCRLLLMPWAYHIGGQSFPNTQWMGYGRLHSASGKDQGLYMQIGGSIWLQDKSAARWRMNPGYSGNAWLCSPKGERFVLDVSGEAPTTSRPWLSTDGTKAFFYLRPPGGGPGSMRLDLHGEWKGRDLIVDDGGTLDGKPGQHAGATLRMGSLKDFQALCESLK